MSFRGYFEHTLDAKKRLTVPSKFRAPLSDGFILARAFEPCVAVWTPDAWKTFTERFLAPLNPFSNEARRLQRFFHSGSFDAELDSAGRLMVPQSLAEYAGIEKEVAVVGNQQCFELWDLDSWQRYESDLGKTIAKDAENIAARD